MDQPMSKTCVRCGRDKPASEYYRRTRSKDGLGFACKTCLAQRRRERRAKSAEDKAAEIEALRTRPTKACTACGVEKPRAEFRAKKRSRDGMTPWCKACESAWHAEHYRKNRDEILEAHRTWYVNNREKRRASAKAYYEANRVWLNKQGLIVYQSNRERFAEKRRKWNAGHPEWRRRLTREWREKNRERALERERQWREKNRERLRELDRASYRRNREKIIDRASRRRAWIAGTATGPVDLDALWTGVCGICGEELDRDLEYPDPMSKSIDHIVPISQGGGHVQDNLQWAHLLCNVSKGNKVA